MDKKTSGKEQEHQEQNDKLESEVVGGRRQLKPNVVNISFKDETDKEDCKGITRVRRCSSGRLRELGYATGDSEPGSNADGRMRVRSAHQVRLKRNG